MGAAFFVDRGMTLCPSFASNEEHNTEKHSNSTSKKRQINKARKQ